MRVVVDTNVLVSGLISSSGPPAEIVDAILKGTVVPVMSQATFAELEEVLHRPRLLPYFKRADITPFQLLASLEKVAQFIKPKPSKVPLRDPSDRIIAELAATRPAPDFIVTGDRTSSGTITTVCRLSPRAYSSKPSCGPVTPERRASHLP